MEPTNFISRCVIIVYKQSLWKPGLSTRVGKNNNDIVNSETTLPKTLS